MCDGVNYWLCVLLLANWVLWMFNGVVALSDDPPGRGVVQMYLIPFTFIVGLISIAIIGFIT